MEQGLGSVQIGFGHFAFAFCGVDGEGDNQIRSFLLSFAQTLVVQVGDFDFGFVFGPIGEQFGRLNFGQQSAFFDLVTFIDRDCFQITGYFRVKSGSLIRFDFPGQCDAPGDLASGGMGDLNVQRRLRFGGCRRPRPMLATAQKKEREHDSSNRANFR